MLDSLTGATYFSTLDLISGYWQVKVYSEDKEKRKLLYQERRCIVLLANKSKSKSQSWLAKHIFSQSLSGLCNIKFLFKVEWNLVRVRVVFLMQLKGFYIYISRMRFMQHVDHVLINSHSNRRKLHDIGHKTMNTYSFFLMIGLHVPLRGTCKLIIYFVGIFWCHL